MTVTDMELGALVDVLAEAEMLCKEAVANMVTWREAGELPDGLSLDGVARSITIATRHVQSARAARDGGHDGR